ncbi:protein FAR-RED IMPAIRED RESPONSE 1 [Sesamum angolense]|uniref:Protein FAR1-RELATED SEQUENCE n=1 Tax=Sesamum angolense TaxID=2727404 RepID=A0AAE1X269_9LAMI|nr:protein FAR-RED IMPAIRED RESPONSE 1 [Sesamum angolense]
MSTIIEAYLTPKFESDEQAYRFYNKYAELVGFSVRKDWVNRSKVHGRVMSRKFTCSRQGHRKKDKRDVNVKKHRKETRTGCLAHMVVTRQPNGKYLVTQFEAEHNHEDVNLTKAQKLLESPLFGKGNSAEFSETDSMKNKEIHSNLSFHLLGIRFCPPDNFDDLQVSDEVFLSSGRTRDMKEGDAARLMYYFQRQHFENPSFFYSVQLDDDEQAVTFGAAFLYDDSVNSFKWLVRTFVEAMSGRRFYPGMGFYVGETCLRHNAWLRWMFREKEKWAVAYGRNAFFIERNGTHLVELMSDRLRSYLGPDIDMLQFFKHFESVVNEQRYRELESTLDMGRQAPVLMANAVLLKYPSETYTPMAFEVFQREYEKCLNIVVNKCGERDSRFDFKVKTYGKSREFLVIYNSLDGTVSCNCMKFEHVGFLCSHALKVLDHQNIKVVPSYYILRRWTKDARILPVGESHSYPEDDNRKIVATRYKICVGVDVLKGTTETENMVPNKDQLNHCDDQIPGVSGGLSSSPPETVLSVACGPSTYISSPSPTPSLSPLTQTSNLAINQQSNPNMYESPNFYSNQHHSPSHSQFLQFQDPMSNGTQMKQVMDDSQHTHSSSFMHYNHRYRAAGVSAMLDIQYKNVRSDIQDLPVLPSEAYETGVLQMTVIKRNSVLTRIMNTTVRIIFDRREWSGGIFLRSIL